MTDITGHIRHVELYRGEADRCTPHDKRVLVDSEGLVWHIPDDEWWVPSRFGSLVVRVDPLTRDEKLTYIVSPCGRPFA